ncbi:MAG: hypothetical protein LBT86_05425 [Deltaproteobacteria bacterium]|nr:hypothetical protein [Deltaproteobacteria bacterium]
MKKLTRLGVFIRTINEFLKRLKKNHRDLFNQIDPELNERYWSTNSGDNSFLGDQKPSENQRTLEQAVRDLFSLANRFADEPIVLQMSSFKLLKRVLSDQWGRLPGKLKMANQA